MAVQAEQIYRDRETIVDLLIAALLTRVSDAHVDEDSNIRLLWEIVAGEIEGNYLANEILRNDIFIQLASAQALDQHGEMFGRPRKEGSFAIGNVRFSGAGGSFIVTGTQIASDPGADVLIYFSTQADATIPNPGMPTACVATAGAAGNITGTIEYVVTFQTVEGETVPGPASTPVVVAAKQIDLSVIPIGGTGTTGRRIYRRKDGGDYKLVTTIANNTATTFNDNVTDGALGAAPPLVSTAERVTVAAQADEVGVSGNVIAGAINEVVEVPPGVSSVTNIAPFAGGIEPEETETFRTKLLEFVRTPKSGSGADLEVWAEAISGVETATAFANDNLGTPQNGHTTVRIAGPNGAVPSGAVIAAVQADLNSRDVANIVVHVTTFTAVPTNVTVVVTPATGFVLGDVSASVSQAITDYINNTPVGGTVYKAGIIDAVFGLNGVANVTTTFTDTTQTATQKATPGTISVT
jgi:uncharacterized phage protein gp47/JayE